MHVSLHVTDHRAMGTEKESEDHFLGTLCEVRRWALKERAEGRGGGPRRKGQCAPSRAKVPGGFHDGHAGQEDQRPEGSIRGEGQAPWAGEQRTPYTLCLPVFSLVM